MQGQAGHGSIRSEPAHSTQLFSQHWQYTCCTSVAIEVRPSEHSQEHQARRCRGDMQKQKQLFRASANSERQQHPYGQMPRSPRSCNLLPKLWHAQDYLTRLALQGQQGKAEDHHAEEHSSLVAVAAIDHGVSSSGEILSTANQYKMWLRQLHL